MDLKVDNRQIREIGEKRLIAEFLQPLFNPESDPGGVGDDCAMVEGEDNQVWLFSTDRVPADLISFRLGILDFEGLGGYLARLNLSDIAACGGRPVGLLLNFGLPQDLLYSDFRKLCVGCARVAKKFDTAILGGDISSASEISISATSIGKVEQGRQLSRRGARPGDTVFVSRPLGLTPAAFAYFLRVDANEGQVGEQDREVFNRQFTSTDPMIDLARALAISGSCTSCMDNTDGIGQSLLELSIASGCRLVVRSHDIELLPIVHKIATLVGENPFALAFGAGADFSLVGTLQGKWSQEQASRKFGDQLRIIGYAESGTGVFLQDSSGAKPLTITGWNYFSRSELRTGKTPSTLQDS